MLLLLQLIGLSSVAFAQFFGGPHPLSAGGHSGLSLSNYGNGESETLPISQHELAQLMAQSLASSSGKNYGPPPYAQKQSDHSSDDDFGSNYEGGEEGAEPQQPDEESNNEGGYEQQERGEGSPYRGQQGHSEDEQGGSDEGRENSDGYENSGPNYQGEGQHYQSGQYPESQGYGSHNSEEQERGPQSGYDDNHNSQYDESSQSRPYRPESGSNGYQHQGRGGGGGGDAQREYQSAVNARGPHSNDYYSGPGSGYSGQESESYLTYDMRNSPKSNRFRS